MTNRDYLLAVFDELAVLPGTHEVFGEHNPIRELPNWLSGDAGGELLRFFQKIDANTGALVHDFTDPAWDTRFLGDLYQDLSEAARKKYALLQTPKFVEEFILERTLEPTLGKQIAEIGRTVGPGDDDAWWLGSTMTARRLGLTQSFQVLVTGQDVRDFTLDTLAAERIVYPYNQDSRLPLRDLSSSLNRFLWPSRTLLRQRVMFGRPMEAAAKFWWEYLEHYRDRLCEALSIVFAEIATHNHFVLDRGGKLFNRTAPVIKLPPQASEDDYLALLGLLNTSTACFWMQQTCHNKGRPGANVAGADERYEMRYVFNGTNLLAFPITADRPLQLARQLDSLAQAWSNHSPSAVLTVWTHAVLDEQQAEAATGESRIVRSLIDDDTDLTLSLRDRLEIARKVWEALRGQMITLQEELDWECYRLYGLTEEDLTLRREDAKQDNESTALRAFAPSREIPVLRFGQRAFEIVMARRMAAGELQTTWFERHGSTPTTEIPADWPDDYKRLVERRIELIETDRNIGLIEQPEYKRRWNTEPWESQLERALRDWLLDRLESYFDFDGRMNAAGQATAKLDIALTTVSRLADVARQDADFMQVGEVYRDDRAFNVDRLVAELVEAESVPLLPILRYKPSGLRKRAEWEQTWELQREEDRRVSVVSGPLSVAEDNGQRTTDH